MKPELSVVGIDLAKSIFHLVGMDERGKIILRKRLTRGEVMPFMATLPRVLVGMEACGGAHYWARQLRAQGHEVKLMAPQYVKPSIVSGTILVEGRQAIVIDPRLLRDAHRRLSLFKKEGHRHGALPSALGLRGDPPRVQIFSPAGPAL